MVAQPIYKVFMAKYKESWYELTAEEQNKIMAENTETLKQAGAELIVLCTCWSSEEWLFWGVEKYPDIEAVQKHTEKLFSMNWFKYIESKTYLGTEFPMQ